MDPRQRGVAHVNIFWCLVPLVLMFAGAGYGYMKHVEADENLSARRTAEAAREDIKFKFDEREKQLAALTEVLGNAGEFDKPVAAPDDYKSPSNYTTPAKLKQAFAVFNGKMGTPGSFDTLNDVLGAAASKLTAEMDTVKKVTKQFNDSQASVDTARQATDAVKTAKDGEISNLQTTLAGERSKLDRQVADSSTQLAEARQKTRDAIQEKENAVKAANASIAAKDTEIKNLEAANLWKTNKLKLINSPAQPDARVLSASPLTDTAWINIGSKDMVKVGLTFRVLAPQQGGTYKFKANGRVVEVENDRAKIEVSNLVNKLDPVVRNDVVANDLYSANLKRTVFLIGRFVTPYTKGEVKRILEDYGNTVVDEMGPQVDLVIVGRQPIGEDVTKIEDTEEFRSAASWNIEIATLHKIRDFLKL